MATNLKAVRGTVLSIEASFVWISMSDGTELKVFYPGINSLCRVSHEVAACGEATVDALQAAIFQNISTQTEWTTLPPKETTWPESTSFGKGIGRTGRLYLIIPVVGLLFSIPVVLGNLIHGATLGRKVGLRTLGFALAAVALPFVFSLFSGAGSKGFPAGFGLLCVPFIAAMATGTSVFKGQSVILAQQYAEMKALLDSPESPRLP